MSFFSSQASDMIYINENGSSALRVGKQKKHRTAFMNTVQLPQVKRRLVMSHVPIATPHSEVIAPSLQHTHSLWMSISIICWLLM